MPIFVGKRWYRMINLEQFKDNAARHGMMCWQYAASLETARSNKQIIDIALSVQAFDVLGSGIAEGWGISPEYICRRFDGFINGKYVSRQNGYTSKMYCLYDGKAVMDTATAIFIDCDVALSVPGYVICEVYCTGDCSLEVSGGGRAVFVCYGSPEKIRISGSCGNMKRINKFCHGV